MAWYFEIVSIYDDKYWLDKYDYFRREKKYFNDAIKATVQLMVDTGRIPTRIAQEKLMSIRNKRLKENA